MNPPDNSSVGSPRGDTLALRLALIAAGAVLAFAVVTNQVWEDYYITFRVSQNFVSGHGLVYQAGERVQTFTSPLGVLLPALGLLITGKVAGALLFFRVLSAAALGGAAALMAAFGRDAGWKRASIWFIFVMGVLNAKTVAFAANGMETGILLFFAALTWREITRPGGPRWSRLAVGYGGLMWTRPDAFILAGAMTAAGWLFGARGAPTDVRRAWWRKTGAAVLVGGLIYAPWFLGAWMYYGSPVPQTIAAKAEIMPAGVSALRILFAPLQCLVENTALDGVFAPAYFELNWPHDLINVFRLLARLGAWLWIVPALPRFARAASLAVMLGAVYLHQIAPYPWYFGPWTLLASTALAGGLDVIASRWTGRARASGQVLASLVAAGSLVLLGLVTYTFRWQQRYIEDRGRRQIGLWLHAHAAPGDTVFLESLGYIGYFSQLKTLDVPGLSAPEVSRLMHDGHRDYATLIKTLHPSWVVIRPLEFIHNHLDENDGLRDYVLVGHSNVRPLLDRISFLPSRGELEYDAEYLIFRRQDAPRLLAPAPSAAGDSKP